MSSTNWQRRWDPFRDIQREVGRLFETFEPFAQTARVSRVFPRVNLYDAGVEYVITAQLPGVEPDEVDLSITGDTITLRGERKRLEGLTDENFRRQERQYGKWSRSITLPDRIEGQQVSASFLSGILTVKLPKSASAQPRQISVTAQSA